MDSFSSRCRPQRRPLDWILIFHTLASLRRREVRSAGGPAANPNFDIDVRFWGQSGHDLLRRECLFLTRSGHSQADHMERAIEVLGQTGVMPANFKTLPHFSVWCARSLPKSAGEPGSVEAPSSVNRACDLGSARTAFIALLTLSMASPGVLFGAPKPYHALAS